MDRLLTILRAVHCRSTHHYFALDGLQHAKTKAGQRLASVLLTYHDRYLTGAKDPDVSFRDFENHVLHVEDNMWGGAILSAETWHAKWLADLRAGNWRSAAYAAGVLSHYFTDPFMPLHTAQSSREAALHRPIEWSVCKSYEKILERSRTHLATTEPAPQELTEQWLREMIIHGATTAHQYYLPLLDHYNVSQATSSSMGLNTETTEIFARLFTSVLTAWGQVIDRTAAMVTSEIPEMKLSMATVLATIDMPLMWIVRRISSVAEKVAVQRILQEYQTHGKVERYMPLECQAVCSVKSRESQTAAIPQPEEQSPTIPLSQFVAREPSVKETQTTVSDSLNLAAGRSVSDDDSHPSISDRSTEQSQTGESRGLPNILPFAPNPRVDRGRRGKLNPEASVVDAPSIGTKTALRLAEGGVHTVEQLLKVHPVVLAARLDSNWITSDMIRMWQVQANLACKISNLRSVDAQLLTLVGIRELADLLRFEPAALHAAIYQQSQSSVGQRILRESAPPELDRVRRWIDEVQAEIQVA